MNQTDTARTDAINTGNKAGSFFAMLDHARELERSVITLESSLRDYREAVSQAQDALGEFWVTTPTLPAACRALYAEFAKMRTDLAFIREIIARANHTVSDDPVEAVGQLVDEIRKRGAKISRLEIKAANRTSAK